MCVYVLICRCKTVTVIDIFVCLCVCVPVGVCVCLCVLLVYVFLFVYLLACVFCLSVCVPVGVCLSVCVCVLVSMGVPVCVFTCACWHVCVVCRCLCVWVCVLSCVFFCVCMCTCRCVYACLCVLWGSKCREKAAVSTASSNSQMEHLVVMLTLEGCVYNSSVTQAGSICSPIPRGWRIKQVDPYSLRRAQRKWLCFSQMHNEPFDRQGSDLFQYEVVQWPRTGGSRPSVSFLFVLQHNTEDVDKERDPMAQVQESGGQRYTNSYEGVVTQMCYHMQKMGLCYSLLSSTNITLWKQNTMRMNYACLYFCLLPFPCVLLILSGSHEQSVGGQGLTGLRQCCHPVTHKDNSQQGIPWPWGQSACMQGISFLNISTKDSISGRPRADVIAAPCTFFSVLHCQGVFLGNTRHRRSSFCSTSCSSFLSTSLHLVQFALPELTLV